MIEEPNEPKFLSFYFLSLPYKMDSRQSKSANIGIREMFRRAWIWTCPEINFLKMTNFSASCARQELWRFPDILPLFTGLSI
jgi:hypothetical protein